MRLNLEFLLGELCPDTCRQQARRIVRELKRLLKERRIALTPLVLVRLEEFLMLYHVVQGIETRVRNEGLLVPEKPGAKTTTPKKGATGSEGTVPTSNEPVAVRVHPLVEASFKARDRLTKSAKEIETMLAANEAEGPASLAELLAPFADEFQEEAVRKEAERRKNRQQGGQDERELECGA